jgi:hypothetical protein
LAVAWPVQPAAIPIPHRGSLHADLAALVRSVIDVLDGPSGRALLDICRIGDPPIAGMRKAGPVEREHRSLKRRNEGSSVDLCGVGKGGSAPPLPIAKEISGLRQNRYHQPQSDDVDLATHLSVGFMSRLQSIAIIGVRCLAELLMASFANVRR